MSMETLDTPLSYEKARGKPMPSDNHRAIQMTSPPYFRDLSIALFHFFRSKAART
jgi:hypothetical protein